MPLQLHLHDADGARFAWLTSHGASAISVFWLDGVSVEPGYPHQRWLVGHGGQLIDQAMACPYRDGVLITCHGGAAVRQAVHAVLLEAGAVPHQFSAFGSSRFERLTLDLLPRAEGAAAVAMLLEAAAQASALGRLRASEVTGLLAESDTCRFLFEPPRVQLWGPVNAGKSSLMNTLCGQQLAATGAEPGLTRDVLEGRMEHEGFVLRVFDAPGEMQGGSALDVAAQQHALKWRDQADLVLQVSAQPRQVTAPGFTQPYDVKDAASLQALKSRLVDHFYGPLKQLPPERRFALNPELRADLAAHSLDTVRAGWL